MGLAVTSHASPRCRAVLTPAVLGMALFVASPAHAQLIFATPVRYNVGAYPGRIEAADLNGDGLPEVIVTTDQGIVTLLNKGDGTLGLFRPVFSGATGAVSIADLNRDGALDLAVADGHGLTTALNKGDGTFHAPVSYPASNTFAVAVATGDFDRDGYLDAALVSVGLFGGGPTLQVFRNRGDATFLNIASIGMTDGGEWVIAPDVNNDGYADLVTANGNTNGTHTVSVMLNRGDGTFATRTDYVSSNEARRVTAGDLNNDGAIDLVLSGGGSLSVAVMMNTGNGTMRPSLNYFTNYYPGGVAIADFDGDGNRDVAAFIVGGNPNPLVVLRGNGDGTLQAPITVGTFPSHPGWNIAAADLDGNGAEDLIVADNAQNPLSTSINVVINQRLPPIDRGLRLSTDHGGNSGKVTVTLFGSGIAPGSLVKLSCPGQPDIQGTNVAVDPSGATLTATFDLVGATAGQCVVTLIKPDGATQNAAKLFSIEAGGAPDIWTDLVGFSAIRINRPQTFYVLFGNRGNVDAKVLHLWVSFPAEIASSVSGAVPSVSLTTSGGDTLLGFDVPAVAAGASSAISLSLTALRGGLLQFPIRVWGEGR